MRVEINHPSALTESDWNAWSEIRSSDPRLDSPYLSPEFTRILGSARLDAKVIVAFDETEKPFCFLPVQVSGFGLARALGAPFSDCHGPIIANEHMLQLPRILQLAGISGYAFTGMIAPDDFDVGIVRDTNQASIADLSPGFDVYLESRRSEYPKHFKKARRLGRQSAREAGELTLEFHSSDVGVLHQLIDWKRQQFLRTGLHDVLAPKWVRDMLQRCMNAQTSDFSGVLTTLRMGEDLAAAEFGIRSGSVLHGWISGYNPDFSAYSPGTLLQERLLEAACDQGVLRADLGVGADHYKKYYASGSQELATGVVLAEGAAGHLRRVLGGAWSFAEQSPFGPVAKLAGSARRRLDNILAVETTLSGRVRGVRQAFRRDQS